IFSLCVWYILDNNEKIIKHIFISFLIAFSILIIDGYIQYFFGYNILGWKLYPGPRISSFFGDELIYGSYLSRFLPIVFGLMIINLEKKYIENKFQYFIFLIFILVDVAVFLSGERTAFFLVNFGALLFILASKNYKVTRLTIFLISLILIIILSLINTQSKQRIFDKTFQEMNLFQKNTKNENTEFDKELKPKTYFFSKTHHDHYLSASKMFFGHPIFGIGHKNFRFKCSEKKYLISPNSCTTHPHNYYIQFLSELGIVGFIFLIYAFAKFSIFFSKNVITNFFKEKKKYYTLDDFQVCLFVAILLSLWPLTPSANFFNNWISIVMYFPVGFLLWSFNRK
ncbi:O-antigen ligase family protein, partial [Candidatus Pelagibacter sp.]|nr:O-antigen ligase family protein [Candidatus Pelagibacter sp.]